MDATGALPLPPRPAVPARPVAGCLTSGAERCGQVCGADSLTVDHVGAGGKFPELQPGPGPPSGKNRRVSGQGVLGVPKGGPAPANCRPLQPWWGPAHQCLQHTGSCGVPGHGAGEAPAAPKCSAPSTHPHWPSGARLVEPPGRALGNRETGELGWSGVTQEKGSWVGEGRAWLPQMAETRVAKSWATVRPTTGRRELGRTRAKRLLQNRQ